MRRSASLRATPSPACARPPKAVSATGCSHAPRFQTPAARGRWGRPVGALAAGSRADRSGDTLPESWIFSGNANPVRDVIVGGQMVVRQGVHPHEEQALADYRRAVARLNA